MSLSLHTIKPAKEAIKKRKRVGRGNSSGHGTYSCRGLKGQKARSGVSGLKRLGMKQMLLQTPKKRGFKSAKPKYQVINFDLINKYFKNNSLVDPKALLRAGLINTIKLPVKILGRGDLKVKGLQFAGEKMSKKVKKQAEERDEKEEVKNKK